MKPRTFCVGDIHGRLHALNEVLDMVDFRDKEDILITLGDICDGGTKTHEVIDRLLQISNRIDIIGNHDLWFTHWVFEKESGVRFREFELWTNQGGLRTRRSYGFNPDNVPDRHREFLLNQLEFYVDENNNIFVHGGFNPKKSVENQSGFDMMWDRKLLKHAVYTNIKGYNHVFVGHTSTQMFKDDNEVPITHPITNHNLTMCDCGAGWNGRLALVNVNNPSEYYLSGLQTPIDEPGEESGLTSDYVFGH